MTNDSGLSEHSDSSDFDGTSNCTMDQIKKRKDNWKVFRPKSKKDDNTPTCSSSYTVTENSSREIWKSKTIRQNGETVGLKIRKSYKNKTCKTFDGGDQIETIKSKRASTRCKVIPCLSNTLGQTSNNVKQMSIIRENRAENANIDTGCQAIRVNGEHKIRKFNRSQQFCAVQPVYAVEGNVHAETTPFQHTKIVREPLSNRKTVGNEKSNDWCLMSSLEDNEHRFLKHELYERRSEIPNINKYNIKTDASQGFKQHKHAEQPFPTKLNQNFEVYTYPCLNRPETGSSCKTSDQNRSNNELPSTCSGFWDYFFAKLNAQNQNQTNNTSKPCKCNTTSGSFSNVCRLCDKSFCTHDLSQGSQTGTLKKAPICCGSTFQRTNSMQIPSKELPPCLDLFLSKNAPPCQEVPPPKSKPREKVNCKCYPEKKKQKSKTCEGVGPNASAQSIPCPAAAMAVGNDGPRPCQLPHANITETLSQKYNGEILCIHNPPCVLINGCLNLPPAKEEVTMDSWPANTSQSKSCSSPHSTYNPKKPETEYCVQTFQQTPFIIQNSGCQYSSPIIDIRSYNKWRSNEGFQYQNSSTTKPTSVDGSCQYRPSPFELRNHKDVGNDSARTYGISSNEIQKLKSVNESCQYWLSPTEVEKDQNDTSEGCFYYRRTPTEVKKLTTYSKENVKSGGIDLRVSKPRKEKIVQSMCNHSPPCEVVRLCKATNEPILQDPCMHASISKKLPLSLLELKTRNEAVQSYQHRPKCVEVPICMNNSILLSAKEEVATQEHSKCKMVSKHDPPCVIHSCLARTCDSRVPSNAIPDCVHQPMCKMIPACCRNSAKETVSVHTQYPNQCSLV
ncbi:hypothetical protein HF086_000957 [Spodoptera exigua]|uniref:Uncharacterized protein n=1 Tax=Spodoptera exigua TaxID=7107 RepID=A0A922MLF5_SPOEX|nr:hypothetical protein HF086_000957 [Spodoptera exigua]